MGKGILGFVTGILVGLLLGGWVVSSQFLCFRAARTEARGEAVYEGRPTSFWIGQLQDKNPAFRQQAVQALEHIGPAEPAVVPALAEMLKDASGGVRLNTVLVLGRFGLAAQAAIPKLIAALRDPDRYVRADTARALGAIGPSNEAVVAALVPALRDENPVVRRATLETLGTMRADLKSAIDAARAALQDQDPKVRRAAVESWSSAGRFTTCSCRRSQPTTSPSLARLTVNSTRGMPSWTWRCSGRSAAACWPSE